MSDFANWLFGLVKKVIAAVWDFLADIVIEILDLLLQGVTSVISAIPVPAFMQNGGLQGLFNAIPADAMYFIGRFRLGECLAILGAAVLFRLGRKVVTLFQW